MELRTHNMPPDVLKNDSGEFDEVMLQGVEMLFKRIFCIQGIEKKTCSKSF
jgi:hypothetical protein